MHLIKFKVNLSFLLDSEKFSSRVIKTKNNINFDKIFIFIAETALKRVQTLKHVKKVSKFIHKGLLVSIFLKNSFIQIFSL
jgi:hypothetical protein